jgi:hypothetical protein
VARKRKKLSNTVRFEVFKRDSFTCQYCGRKAPEVVLELEHIEPVSKGGSDELLNLITSCWQCNSGKSDRKLDDSTVIARQHAQLAELQERREQLDMLLRWRDGNADLAEKEIDAFCDQFAKAVKGWTINDTGKASIRKLIAKHGLARMLEALDRAAAHKLAISGGKVDAEIVDGVFRLVFIMAEPDEVQRLYRLRARIRRRWNYVHDGICIGLLRRVVKAGAAVDQVETYCDTLMRERDTSFRWWQTQMELWLEELASG